MMSSGTTMLTLGISPMAQVAIEVIMGQMKTFGRFGVRSSMYQNTGWKIDPETFDTAARSPAIESVSPK